MSLSSALLRQQLWLVSLAAILAVLAMFLPLAQVQLPHAHYLPLHTALEFVAIAAAFLVFATVWHTPTREESASLLLIATALFAAGWLDFFHTLSFKGMPDLITPASVEKGIAFWLAARLIVALTLVAVSLLPRLPTPTTRLRLGVLAGYTALNLLVIWSVLFHEAALPRTYVEGAGLTALKRWLEWLITGLLALAAWRFYRLARRAPGDDFLPLIFGAAAIAALSELFFAQYETISDALNLLGHLYKFISYGLIYRAMFVVSVRRPYQALARQTATLQQANETLRTQSLALESIAASVLVTDPDGRVRWRNRASLELVDAPAAAPLSLFQAPLTPDAGLAAAMRATLARGEVWRGRVQRQDPQGHDLVLERTVTPLRDDAGTVIGYVSVGENVTEQSRAELRHKRVLDTAIDGFWILDRDGRILEVNEAYERMSGYTAAELIGMHVSQFEAEEDEPALELRRRKLLQLGHDQFMSRHRHKQGHSYAVEISITWDPQARSFYVFMRDRSEREHADAIQLDLERQLQQSQKVQALGQLTGGVAHDFNNILAAILGYSNLALQRFVPDKQGKLASYLREVITASERARDLIAKMLSFTRIQPSTSLGLISPAAVLREVTAMMRPSIPASIELQTRIDGEPTIRMDAGELNQVLVNLIINARDAVDEHGLIDIRLHTVQVDGQICAASQQRLQGRYVALDVSDNGSGIAPEHLSRLFDPFFTTKDVGKGTGLGLSVVHGILRRSGAHIVVDSSPGRGSLFRLLFAPAEPAAETEGAQADETIIPAGTGQQIWVVDNEAAVARYLEELLADWGYRARTFGDPAEALAALEAAPGEVDALITDQTMPGLSGLQLAQLARHFKPGLPVLLCTGFSDSIDAGEARRLGIHHIFSKPLPVRELMQALADELHARPAA